MEAEDLHVPSPVSKAGQARAATVPTAAAVAVVTSVSVLPMPPVVSVPPVALPPMALGGSSSSSSGTSNNSVPGVAAQDGGHGSRVRGSSVADEGMSWGMSSVAGEGKSQPEGNLGVAVARPSREKRKRAPRTCKVMGCKQSTICKGAHNQVNCPSHPDFKIRTQQITRTYKRLCRCRTVGCPGSKNRSHCKYKGSG